MKKRIESHPGIILLLCSTLFFGCILIVKKNKVRTEADIEQVNTPVKAHLNNGKTVYFSSGAIFTPDKIVGDGLLYSLTLVPESPVESVDRNEVAAFEVYSSEVEPGSTIAGTIFATGVSIPVYAYLAVLIFGSCPTVYAAESDSTMVIQSELFSNSIAPVLETRDLVSIMTNTKMGEDVVLEVRNEAVETHYINQLELVEVFHESDEIILPSSNKTPLAIKKLSSPISAVDMSGNDVLTEFLESDSKDYNRDISSQKTKEGIAWDHLEVTFPPTGESSGAVYIKLRNSLFTSVFMYDHLLAAQGIHSLNWLGESLSKVSDAVALGDFSYQYLGLKVEQLTEDGYQEIGVIANPGPIAWREFAVPVFSMNSDDSLKIRFRFLADSWRINEIKLAASFRIPEVNQIPVSNIYYKSESITNQTAHLLKEGDNSYFITYPGDHFSISFETTAEDINPEVSYLLASQGYYTEWIRNSWLEDNQNAKPIQYSDELIIEAQKSWVEKKAYFEKEFFNSKVQKH